MRQPASFLSYAHTLPSATTNYLFNPTSQLFAAMTPDERSLNKPEVTFEFNLPHGIDSEEATHVVANNAKERPDSGAEVHCSLDQNNEEMTGLPSNNEQSFHYGEDQVNENNQDLTYRQFSPGFSDDEGSGEAFERSWPGHQAAKQAAKTARGRKSPRRSDNASEDSGTKARAKKPRQSLFGRADEVMDIDEQVNDLFAPATPGFGLGNRMSSLALDQEHNGDEVEHPMSNSFGLACSDIGSVRDSTPPSDDEVVIPTDTVVSSLGLLFS